MNKDIKKILDTWPSLKDKERLACRKFLNHIYNKSIPGEGTRQHPSALQARADAAKSDGFQRNCLLGDYWETMFCDKASAIGFYSVLLQRHKVRGGARASKDVGTSDKKREDIGLPDALLHLPGKGPVAYFDIKHNKPFGAYPMITIDYYTERVDLCGETFPYFFVFHNYLPFDFKEWKKREFQGWKNYWDEHIDIYREANKWSLNNHNSQWLAVRVLPDTPTEHHSGYTGVNLVYFEPLITMLKELKKGYS